MNKPPEEAATDIIQEGDSLQIIVDGHALIARPDPSSRERMILTIRNLRTKDEASAPVTLDDIDVWTYGVRRRMERLQKVVDWNNR